MKKALIATAVLAVSLTFAGTASAHFPKELAAHDGDTCTGKPAVVTQRNDATKALRDGFHDAHKQLMSLRGGGKDVDTEEINSVVDEADAELKGVLRTALVDLFDLTFGEGAPGATSDATADLDEDTDEDDDDSGQHGRPCDVPAPEADQAAVDALVADALDDMAQIVTDTATELDREPVLHGKPATAGQGKPESAGQSGQRGKSGSAPGRNK